MPQKAQRIYKKYLGKILREADKKNAVIHKIV